MHLRQHLGLEPAAGPEPIQRRGVLVEREPVGDEHRWGERYARAEGWLRTHRADLIVASA
jgi:hypothetical protein